MNVAEMKQAGKGKINPENARKKADAGKGAALATLCVNYATEEANAEEKRGQKRMRFVHDIGNLSPDGHAAFRAELQRTLAFLDESETAAVNIGAISEKTSRHGGYSLASFRVMVSNWRTISVACESGMKVDQDASWENVLHDARAQRKQVQATGGALIEGTRKQGAGRKAASPYEKALKVCLNLSPADKKKLVTALAATLNASVEFAAPKAKKAAPFATVSAE